VGRCGQHVIEVVVQNPVLLGREREVVEPGGDGVLDAERGDLDAVVEIVVGRTASALAGLLAGVRRELAADQLQIVG
jgi:hypothetical protein